MKYTVHRALALLKTTKARIERELDDENILWVRVARGQEEVVSGVAVKDIRRDIQAHYDRITALIANYMKIKAAVIRSNAGVLPDAELRKAEVAGKLLTVAECPAAHCNRRFLQINVDRFSYGNLQFRANGTLSAEARRSLSSYNLKLRTRKTSRMP